MGDRLATAALLVAFIAVGAGAWALALRPPLQVDPAPLDGIPYQIASWHGQDVSLETEVERMLRADFNVQRRYVHPLGAPVWLYLGYYGTDRGGRPEHTPSACYQAHGWTIVSRRRLEVPGGPVGLRVNEYLVEKDGERQLVHFWFRSFRSTGLLGIVDQSLDRLLGRLLEGRADGALVRLSTGLRDRGEVDARSQLLSFAAGLDPELAAHWPAEIPVER